ncbi:hypothetical protein KUTeg_006561 [Tegillarca granosa]|uniref:Uncharacterized protein n=1 Tax=Tegillarca granosa TaxID=220873 RepID=A0ABQ9FJM5_TEGGR|nr:hypothetical protein KUTeg_006561 [Tegillarca granosa]
MDILNIDTTNFLGHLPQDDVISNKRRRLAETDPVQAHSYGSPDNQSSRVEYDFDPIPSSSHAYSDIESFDTDDQGLSDDESDSEETNQIGFGSTSLPYEIRKVNERTFKNSVIDRHYKVKFHPDEALENQKLSNLQNELGNMFEEVLNDARDGLQGSDLMRVIINHPNLNNPVYVPLQKVNELDSDKIMEYLENVLTSHENLEMNQDFSLDIGTMQLPSGGARVQITRITGPNNSLSRKYSIIEIQNTDSTCLARAILMGFLKTKTMSTNDWKSLTNDDSNLDTEDLVLKYKACPEWYFRDLKRQKIFIVKQRLPTSYVNN